MLTRRTLLAAPLLLCITAPATAEQPAQNFKLEGIAFGDRWTYENTDDLIGELKFVVTFVVAEIIGETIAMRSTRKGLDGVRPYLYDMRWNLIDDGVWKKTPHDGAGINGPLKVGQEWRASSKLRNMKKDATHSSAVKSKVVALEPITVKAGTYEAYRIETEIQESPSDGAAPKAQHVLTTWYVPEVNRWVKRTGTFRIGGRIVNKWTDELIEYKRGGS